MMLKDQVAVVTGAGQGIGAASAKALAEAGAIVVAVDIDGALVEKMAGSLAAHQHRTFAIAADAATSVLDQHDGDHIVCRVDRELHHVALHFIAPPDALTAQKVNGLEPRFVAEVAGEKYQVRSGDRRHCRFIYLAGFASPDPLAGFAVDGI